METLDLVVNDKDTYEQQIDKLADAIIAYCIQNGIDPNSIKDLNVIPK